MRLMNKNKSISKAIRLLGGPVAAAKKLGVGRYQTVQGWVRSGNIPARHSPDVELLTGVPCEEICPDVNWLAIRKSS